MSANENRIIISEGDDSAPDNADLLMAGSDDSDVESTVAYALPSYDFSDGAMLPYTGATFLAAVFDPANNQITIDVNGTRVVSSYWNPSNLPYTHIAIGKMVSSVYDMYFDGVLEHVAIWSSALSTAQLDALRLLTSKPDDIANLVAWLPLKTNLVDNVGGLTWTAENMPSPSYTDLGIDYVGGVSGAGKIASEEAFGYPTLSVVVEEIFGVGNIPSEAFVSSPRIGPPLWTYRDAAEVFLLSDAGAPMPRGSSIDRGENTDALLFGKPIPAVSGVISAAGIPSEEAVGSATLRVGISSSGIASAEAVGSAGIRVSVSASGIPTAEATEAPSLRATVQVSGVPSGEAFGTPEITTVAGIVGAGGIASLEAIGAPTVRTGVLASGIASLEASGAPTIRPRVAATGIPSGEAVGSPTVDALWNIGGSGGIASGEAVGSQRVSATVASRGVPSTEAAGSPGVRVRLAVAPIESSESVGSPSTGVELRLIGIVTEEAVGSPVVFYQILLTGVGNIESLEAFGNPIVKQLWVPDAERIAIVRAEARVAKAVAEDRTVSVPTTKARVEASPEDRSVSVSAERRIAKAT